MSTTRRMLLMNWAVRTGAWIIEDSYDSEYRLDSQGEGIYVGTFSSSKLATRAVCPDTRLMGIESRTDLV